MTDTTQPPILVTGASGFLAMHVTLQLLQQGLAVRGTVRSLERGEWVRRWLKPHVDTTRLDLAVASLETEAGWSEAVRGCRFVLHVASPVPRSRPKTTAEVVMPAVEGALRVLRAAARHGVERVVLTSSTASVFSGQPRDRVLDEKTWANLEAPGVSAYARSKTLAERAAWDFVATLPSERRLELVCINPGVMLGPVLSNDVSISGEVVRKLLAGELPGVPELGFATVDVRDVAAAHVKAMSAPAAAGHRFIVANDNVAWVDIARLLSKRFAERGFRIPTRRLPSMLLRVVAWFDETAAVAVPELGKQQLVSSALVREVLKLELRPLEESVVEMAETFIALGLVRPRG